MFRIFSGRFYMVALVAVTIAVCNSNQAQGQRRFFEDITLTGAGGNFTDLTFRANNDANNDYRLFARTDGHSLDLDGPNDACIFRVLRNSKRDTLLINELGLAIGTPFSNSSPGLHVFSDGGNTSPFTDATVRIENAEPVTMAREQLRLVNNGPNRFAMFDTNNGVVWSIITTGINGDGSDSQFQIRRNGPNTANIAIRASGAFAFGFAGQNQFTISPNGNAFLRGALTQNSDRNEKKNIRLVDPQQVLSKVASLPISSWTYNDDQDDVRHLGPMAQDFRLAFGLGENATSISTLDTSGVALSAVQGLHQRLQAKDKQISELNERLDETTADLASMQSRLERLELLVGPESNRK